MAPTPRPESRPPDRAVPVEASKFTRYPEVDFSQFLIAPGPGVESEVSGSHVAYLFQHNSRARPEGWFISHRVYYWPEREHHLELVIEDPRRRLGDEWFQDPPPRPERSPDRSNPTTPPQAPRDLSETPSAPTTQRIRRTAAATQYLAQTSTSTTATTPTTAVVKVWGQCGGANYQGPTACVAGSVCVASNSELSRWPSLHICSCCQTIRSIPSMSTSGRSCCCQGKGCQGPRTSLGSMRWQRLHVSVPFAFEPDDMIT